MEFWKKVLSNERLKMDDMTYLSKLLDTNLPISQCLTLIENTKNSKILKTISTRLDHGEVLENIIDKHIPKEIEAFVDALLLSLPFNQALSLSLKFYHDHNSDKNELLVSLAYPCILLFITISALYLFDLYGIDAIFSLIASFESNITIFKDLRVLFRIMINVIYFGILLTTLLIVLFIQPKRIVLLYIFISKYFPNSLFNIYYSQEFMALLKICLDSGFKTRQSLELLKAMKSKPIISFLAFHLDESLSEGETMKEAASKNYYDQALKKFIKIGNYTSDFSNIISTYVDYSRQRVKTRLKTYATTIQIATYSIIGVIVVFIYQILFMPMQAISIY